MYGLLLWMGRASFTITVVVNELKSPTAIQAEHPIPLIHLSHSAPLPAPPSLAKITWCNLHAPSRCRGWWMPTIHTRPSRIQHNSTFIAGDNRYVLQCTIFILRWPGQPLKVCFWCECWKAALLLGFTPYYLFLGDTVMQFQRSVFLLHFPCAGLREYSCWVG